jgi:cephalosporin-C deacetylase
MLTDLSEDELWAYRSTAAEPGDFDAFWRRTLDEAATYPLDVRATEVDGAATLRTWDVEFAGFGGAPIRGWYSIPRGAAGPLPTVVQYVGYNGGRGHVLENLLWASSGFAHFVMDNRGQGSSHREGVTPDPVGRDASTPGMLTSGLSRPDDHYYRRLFVDAVRAVEVARHFDETDQRRLAVVGGSQGGAMSLAVGALSSVPAAVVSFVPFLSDIRRATERTDQLPYREIIDYLGTHRRSVEQTFDTLSYFDGVNFARRGRAPALFSSALLDDICPPSTVFGAFHAYAGEKRMTVWPFNGHIGGGIEDEADAVAFLRDRFDLDREPARS